MRKDADSGLIKEFLKEIPIFKSLSDRHLSRLSEDFIVCRINKGETIFHQSDDSTDLYIILDGAVRASLVNEDGEKLVLAAFNKGDFFGEMSLLDGKPRSATMTATEYATLGVLRRDTFLNAAKNDPAIAIDLLSALVQRMRMADGMIESLAFLDVSQRVIKILMQIARTEGIKDKDGFFRIKRLTHKELAARTGASREAVSKAMKVLSFRDGVKEEGDCFLVSPRAEELL
ncbi:MAG: Crp/Fnr family transcriptional regulator [Nitrospirae bacterium]|nr:Crp/Fnr family transcriptional regulator [Nitrospirota bacterium]